LVFMILYSLKNGIYFADLELFMGISMVSYGNNPHKLG
jgi:hypothetical protein